MIIVLNVGNNKILDMINIEIKQTVNVLLDITKIILILQNIVRAKNVVNIALLVKMILILVYNVGIWISLELRKIVLVLIQDFMKLIFIIWLIANAKVFFL